MNDDALQRALPDELVRRALESAAEGIALVDGEQDSQPVVWVNAAYEQISGFERRELIGSNLRVLQGSDRDQPALLELREAMAAGRGCTVLLRNYRPDGAVYWNELRVEPCRDSGGRLWWLGFARDVSEQHEMEIMLGRRADELDVAQRRLSEVDAIDRLTGLQSKRSFEVALELSWFSCARDRRTLALFLFAPDYFETYLETFGRVAGDSCLRMVARSVAAAFRRASDVAARIGETEFAAISTDMEQNVLEGHARRVCERVRALGIRNPHAPQARTMTLSGVVLLARPGKTAHWRALLDDARTALAAGQAEGKEQLIVRDYGADAD